MNKKGQGKPCTTQGLLVFPHRCLLRFHAGPPGLPADGVLGLFWWHHLQYPFWGCSSLSAGSQGCAPWPPTPPRPGLAFTGTRGAGDAAA